MRKVAFINIPDKIKKVMIYDSPEGIYLFGYNGVQDASAIWDNWFQELKDAEGYCHDEYNVTAEDWIAISDPCSNCQHDFIGQVRVKGREMSDPQFGQFEIYTNGRWTDFIPIEKHTSFASLSGNERLFISGLAAEFDKALKKDKTMARKILAALKFDTASIKNMIQ